MCGISAILNFSQSEQADALQAMNLAIHHRGPDEDGIYIDGKCFLAHKRLSIIDLASGQQPFVSRCNRYVIVYNGEVYNFKDIRRELESLGVQFKTHCDTEVIIEAFAQWGKRSIEKFRGMFAFVIYDKTDQKMVLVRDRLGIKPAFYARTKKGDIIISSELKGLTAHPDFDDQYRLESLEEYLALGYVPEPNSIYLSVTKLLPGHWIEWDLSTGKSHESCYWNVNFSPAFSIDEHQAIHEFSERFQEAVKIRMIADVPFGAFLSGGVDSSAVVAEMANLSEQSINTCSIGFDHPQYDESRYADQVAHQYQTNHRSRLVSTDDFELVDELTALYDEPYADSSALPTYRVCQLARENVTVALSGDGADEMLAGYRRYRFQFNEDRVRDWIPSAVRSKIIKPLGRVYPKLDWAPRVFRAKSTLQSLAMDSVLGYFNSVSIINDTMRARLLTPRYRQETNNHYAGELFHQLAKESGTHDPLCMIQYIDIKSYLTGDILTKVDRASMAHSLEVRVPFLDHPLVEWMATLPNELKLKSGIGKYVLKKASENKISKEILYRNKMGFRVPVDKWFRGPLSQSLNELNNQALAESGFIDRKFLAKLIDQHTSGKNDHSATLWTLFMLNRFMSKK